MNNDIDYDVRCGMCGWTGDRDDYRSLENNRCPECNAPAVQPDPDEHPEAYVGTDKSQSSLKAW